MKTTQLLVLPFLFVLAVTSVGMANDELRKPIAGGDLVFEEIDGVLAFEVEHYFKQRLDEKRAWYLTTRDRTPDVKPDGDPSHIAGASGGAYLELLPDTRRTHGDKLIKGENFSNEPGVMSILSYKVHINNPGRYRIWGRAFSTTSEDNGFHIGLDGEWPESGRRWQTVVKRRWHWESKQRTAEVHVGVPGKLWLDIEKAGPHTIEIALREDGIALDKLLFAKDFDYQPKGHGPEPKVKAGKLPKAYPEVKGEAAAAPAKSLKTQPAAAKAAVDSKGVRMAATTFPVDSRGAYLDNGYFHAINPSIAKAAKTTAPFPFPSGRYEVTLHAAGENDGNSTYRVTINDSEVGVFKSPVAGSVTEEGPKYRQTWKAREIGQGDVVTVATEIGSLNGEDHTRARWSGIVFTAADETTRSAVGKLAAADRGWDAGKKRQSAKPPALPKARQRTPALHGKRGADGDGTVAVSGELKQWHKVTLTLDGPFAHEKDRSPNPFTDYRMYVEFKRNPVTRPGTREVAGYFAADGNAGETSAESGTKWRAHFSPSQPGDWRYRVWLLRGPDAAIGPPAGAEVVHSVKGQFTVAPTDKKGRDLRGKGRLSYVGKNHLQFAGSGEYFLKAGADAPETFLGYADFDGTVAHKPEKVPLKTWKPHVKDWKPGDPTWKDGKGKGMIGAINYLSGKGCNVFSFLPYNAGGDGDNVWPFTARDEKFHYDCSKLDQWSVVFDHATASGMYLHFKLQETEMDDNNRGGHKENRHGIVPTALDGGDLGPERKLYCREIVARFGHNLALNWNLGEENTQTTKQQLDMANYLREVDPYGHHIVVHTFPNQQDRIYGALLGKKAMTGVSLQNSNVKDCHHQVVKWAEASRKAGQPWIIGFDEPGTASEGMPADPGYPGMPDNFNNPSIHDTRKYALWGTLMGGGTGVEYYFGYKLPQNDLVCEDWRSRDRSWDYCRIALEFFRDHKIPFHEMTNADALVGNPKHGNSRYCFAVEGALYLVYLPNGGTCEIDLSKESGVFNVEWFNPRTGGALAEGSDPGVEAGRKVSIGTPPGGGNDDWLAIVRKL